MNFTFNSRDSYLQYRVEWKAKYAQATLDNRAAKQGVRTASQVFAKASSVYSYLVHRPDSAEFKAFFSSWDDLAKAENQKAKARNTARELLEELQAAKVEAERQWKMHCTASRI